MLQRVISLIVDGAHGEQCARASMDANARVAALRHHRETMDAAGLLSPLDTSALHSFGNNYLNPCAGKRGHEISLRALLAFKNVFIQHRL